jgi:hypothetical protein
MKSAFKDMLNSIGIESFGTRPTDENSNDVGVVFTRTGSEPKEPAPPLEKIPIEVTKLEDGTYTFSPMIPSYPVRRMNRKEMKEFILQYCNRHIYTELDVPSNLLTMVFMPLALGGLAVPSQIIPEFPEPPEAPPEAPGAPDPDDLKPVEFDKTKPDKLKKVDPDPETVADITSSIDYEMADEKAMAEYLGGIEKENLTLEAQYQVALKAWKGLKKAHTKAEKARIKAIKDEYAKKVGEHEEQIRDLCEDYDKQLEKYEEKLEKAEEDYHAILAHWLKGYGFVYANLKDAGPRSINGYPMFWKMSIVHKEDMKPLMEGARRELQRRANVDKDLDDLLPEEPEAPKAEVLPSEEEVKRQEMDRKTQKINQAIDLLRSQMEGPISKKKAKRLSAEMEALRQELWQLWGQS